jgi:GT2 family glycosyltransferase
VKVSAIVVSHGSASDVAALLPLLELQVDELVVIANVPGSAPAGVAAIENERPLGYAANLNLGAARTSGDALLAVNPDTRPRIGAVSELRMVMEALPRCGVAGPKLLYPDGRLQPSRRRFPTVSGTIVRRTPLRRFVPQRRHYHAGEPAPTDPVQCDWMLGGFLLLRRTMLDELGGFDEGYRLYGEDIDLQYRAMQAGWQRWYVPRAVVEHAHQAVTDRRYFTRRTLWHWAGIARFVRRHPERLRAL